MRVSVIGAGECCPTIYNEAMALGRLLAKEDYLVVCGGRGGVMEPLPGCCHGWWHNHWYITRQRYKRGK